MHQSAHSLPRWLCVEDIIDLLHINHICEAQRCTAHAGVAHFERFIRHDIPSGISIELHVKPLFVKVMGELRVHMSIILLVEPCQ